MQCFKIKCKMEINFKKLNRTDFVTSFTSLVSMSIFEDVRLVFSDGEMYLDTLTTGILFPFLEDEIKAFSEVVMTLLLPDYSISSIKKFLIMSTTNLEIDPLEQKEVKVEEKVFLENDVDWENIETNGDAYSEEESEAFEHDKPTVIKLRNEQSIALEEIDKNVETPYEGMKFETTDSMLKYLYAYCRKTYTPIVTAVRRHYGEFYDIGFQCAFGVTDHKERRKKSKKPHVPNLNCPWTMRFRISSSGSASLVTVVTDHQNHTTEPSMLRKSELVITRLLAQPNLYKERKITEKFQCDLCEKTFQTKNGFETHKSSKHSENVTVYFCDQCDFSCHNKYYLEKHIQAKHDNTIIKCDLCDFETIWKARLYIHKKNVHEMVRYMCDQCDFSTKHKWGLKNHKASVHGEGELYNCDQCDYKSPIKSGVAKHIKAVHEKTSIFNCPYCNHSTHWRHCLHKHIRKVHRDKIALYGDDLSSHVNK